MSKRAIKVLAALLLPALSGCLYHTRKVQVLKAPAVVMNAKAENLVERINQQFAAIQTLNATVYFQAQVGGTHKGAVTDYSSFRGYILMRKPEDLRVLGLVPVLHTRAFDLASKGSAFKLLIPPKNKAIIGTSPVTRKSANTLENLRPNVFFDSMLIQSVSPESQVYVTGESRNYMDADKKHLLEEPVYDLAILRRKESGNELTLQRVIRFGRVDLRPFEQDIYDEDGNIETQTIYGPYQSFGSIQFPGTVTIKRPLDEYQITITIEKLTLNQSLTDDQFDLKIPEGTIVQRLD